MKQRPTVIGTGLLALDYIISANSSNNPKLLSGGTCGNVMSILSRLGWNSYPVSRLSDGDVAAFIMNDMKRWGVRLDLMQADPLSEPPVFIQRNKVYKCGSIAHFFSRICPSCKSLLPSFKPVSVSSAEDVAGYMPTSSVYFMDRVSRGALILAEKCIKNGALVVFEPSAKADPRLEKEALSMAHIVKYSHERFATPFGNDKSNMLLEIQTLGKNGLRFRSNLKNASTNGWRKISAIPAKKLVDASGSGDWCSAGLISKIGVDGFDGFVETTMEKLIEGVVFGQTLAVWNCGFEGARGGMYEDHEGPISGFQNMSEKRHDFRETTLLRNSRIKICPSCEFSV